MIETSDPAAIKIHRRIPCRRGLQPTRARADGERPAPMRKSVAAKPARAAVERDGPEAAIKGTKLRAADARRKSPMNQGKESFRRRPEASCLRRAKRAATASDSGAIQSARESFTAVARFRASRP